MRTIKLTVLLLLVAAAALSASCGAKKAFPSEDDLRREFKESGDKFRAKYDGKEVAAYGRAGLVIVNDAGGMISFERNNDNSLEGAPSISCRVAEQDAPRFKELKVESGALIRVKGTMKLEPGSMKLENCKLEKVGEAALSEE